MTVIKQAAVLLLGFLAAAIMVGLGMWQLGKYQSQGVEQLRARTQSAPVPLRHIAEPGQEPQDDAFYRQVRLSGHYDTSLQRLLPTADGAQRSRVLTAFILDSGGAIPVLRGTTTDTSPPAPPSGHVHQTGLLLPPEGSGSDARPGGKPTTVNPASLAQSWKPSLVAGFVTLSDQQATAQHLRPEHPRLPTASGRFQNGAYALQWWVFAAFSIAMGIKMAHDLGARASQDDPDGPDSDGDPDPGSARNPDSEPDPDGAPNPDHDTYTHADPGDVGGVMPGRRTFHRLGQPRSVGV